MSKVSIEQFSFVCVSVSFFDHFTIDPWVYSAIAASSCAGSTLADPGNLSSDDFLYDLVRRYREGIFFSHRGKHS